MTHGRFASGSKDMPFVSVTKLVTGAYKLILPIASGIIIINSKISRLTVVSREAKKKQHACASSGPRDHYSELFTRMAALKF